MLVDDVEVVVEVEVEVDDVVEVDVEVVEVVEVVDVVVDHVNAASSKVIPAGSDILAVFY